MFLADTNLLSEMRQLHPAPQVLNWLIKHEAEILISTVTLAELQSGISSLENGKRKTALQEWFDKLRGKYRDSILSFDEPVAIAWGKLDAELKRHGRKIPVRDSFLAATAHAHNLAIATRNEKDFVGTGLKTINPWKQ